MSSKKRTKGKKRKKGRLKIRKRQKPQCETSLLKDNVEKSPSVRQRFLRPASKP